MVAADTRDALVAMNDFQGVLAASLAGLGLLLALAAWAQVAVGLAPLKALQSALVRVREGHTQRLEGRFPTEVQPLVNGFNSVLDRNTEVVSRARTQAGNLAHALKTPLAVLDNAAGQSTDATMAPLVREQVALANRHIHWHLARARAAATGHLPGQRTALAPLLDGLLRVMGKLYPQRQLYADAVPGDCAFAGEGQDLQEMLGNLLDNGCRCARSSVWVGVRHNNTQLQITVEDDGPGIPASQRAEVLLRGVRLDESVPGSGLGLAIVAELAALYGGTITLDENRHGGLSVTLSLPAARQLS
jgi:signal transduction histidine kinase